MVPSSKGALTRKERLASGKALRNEFPTSHADWQEPNNRKDPIDLLSESSQGRIPQLIPIRYGRMMQSPFAFYRGAAAIMAADLANTPTSGISVQACGDCHLLNFGGFATPERRIEFDINDFDETLPAPWEWDIKRLAASVVIAGRHNGFKKAETQEMALRCVQSYREHTQNYAKTGILHMWYERIDTEAILASIRSRKSILRITLLSFFISPVLVSKSLIKLSQKPFIDIEKLLLMMSKRWWIVTKSKILHTKLLESEALARIVAFC